MKVCLSKIRKGSFLKNLSFFSRKRGKKLRGGRGTSSDNKAVILSSADLGRNRDSAKIIERRKGGGKGLLSIDEAK